MVRGHTSLLRRLEGRFLPLAGVLLAVCLACAVGEDVSVHRGTSRGDKGEVVVLGDGDFYGRTASAPTLVDFYAPWCPFCKELEPTWKELAKQVHTQYDTPLRVAKVDATVHVDVADQEEISGYPTIRLYYDGQFYPYLDDPTLDGLLQWLERQAKALKFTFVRRRGAHGKAKLRHTEDGKVVPAKETEEKKKKVEAPEAEAQEEGVLGSVRGIFYAIAGSKVVDTVYSIVDGYFAEHPYMKVAFIYLIGVFHGLFFGVAWLIKGE